MLKRFLKRPVLGQISRFCFSFFSFLYCRLPEHCVLQAGTTRPTVKPLRNVGVYFHAGRRV